MFSWNDLLPIIEEINQLVHILHQSDHPIEVANSLKCSLKCVSKQVKDMVVLLAKIHWYSNICLHIHDMQVNPQIRGSGPKNVKFSSGTYITSDMPESINR
jgi:hypothetical protein